jgi:hypothetical protein
MGRFSHLGSLLRTAKNQTDFPDRGTGGKQLCAQNSDTSEPMRTHLAATRSNGRKSPRFRMLALLPRAQNRAGFRGPAPAPGPPRRPQDGAGRLLRRPAWAGTVPAGSRGGRCPPTPEPRTGLRRRRLGRRALLHHGVDRGEAAWPRGWWARRSRPARQPRYCTLAGPCPAPTPPAANRVPLSIPGANGGNYAPSIHQHTTGNALVGDRGVYGAAAVAIELLQMLSRAWFAASLTSDRLG